MCRVKHGPADLENQKTSKTCRVAAYAFASFSWAVGELLLDDTLKTRKPWDWTWTRRRNQGLPKGENAEQGTIEALRKSDTPSATSAMKLFGGLHGQGGKV